MTYGTRTQYLKSNNLYCLLHYLRQYLFNQLRDIWGQLLQDIQERLCRSNLGRGKSEGCTLKSKIVLFSKVKKSLQTLTLRSLPLIPPSAVPPCCLLIKFSVLLLLREPIKQRSLILDLFSKSTHLPGRDVLKNTPFKHE